MLLMFSCSWYFYSNLKALHSEAYLKHPGWDLNSYSYIWWPTPYDHYSTTHLREATGCVSVTSDMKSSRFWMIGSNSLPDSGTQKYKDQKWNEYCLRLRFCTYMLSWDGENWGNKVNFGVDHAPSEGSIIDLQSSVLPLCHLLPLETIY